MADLLLFGCLADARRARPRRFRCFNAHLMHSVKFGLQGKLVENTSLSLLVISPRSLHNFWNFPRYANHRCTGHATMLTTRGNDRLITVHAPTTVSNIFISNSPTIFRFSKKKKAHTICNNRPHTALSPVWSSESLRSALTQGSPQALHLISRQTCLSGGNPLSWKITYS